MQRELPEGWEKVNLLKYIDIVKPGVKEYSGYKKYISTGSLQAGVIADFVEVNYDDKPSRANMEVRKDDVLFAKMMDTEKTFLVKEIDENNLYSTGFSVLRIKNKNKIIPIYLYYWIRSYYFQSKKNSLCTGATQKAINNSKLKNFTIVVPPLETQHEIVSLLEKAEETKRLRAQADELTQKLIQSVFLEMFGDPLNNSKGWKETDLEYVLAESPQNGLYKPSSDYGSGTPILRIDSFYDGSIADTTYLKRLRCKPAEVKKYQLNIGEILINRVNSLEYLGKCGLVETLYEDTVFESNMMRLKLNHSIINPKYLVYLLCTKYIKNQLNQKAKKAVNQASINQKDVKSLKIKTPPIELQNQFAKLVNQIEKTKQLQQQSSNEMDTLFDSLMQKVFIGELVH